MEHDVRQTKGRGRRRAGQSGYYCATCGRSAPTLKELRAVECKPEGTA